MSKNKNKDIQKNADLVLNSISENMKKLLKIGIHPHEFLQLSMMHCGLVMHQCGIKLNSNDSVNHNLQPLVDGYVMAEVRSK